MIVTFDAHVRYWRLMQGQKSKAAEHLLFSYEAPEIHGLDPTEGPTDGNTRMTLEGEVMWWR